jgi:acetate---CoA ligase (ADP-forming)
LSRDVASLFDPRSVAVVGASDDESKWGHWLARGALRGESRRAVYLVNRKGGQVLGRAAFHGLGDLPEQPELVVISVPAASFEEAVDTALAVGAKAIVGISAGLGEMGGAAHGRERALGERVRSAGAVLLGPNCLGVVDAGADLDLAANDFPPGAIGLVSQSGNVAIEVGLLAQEAGLGFSRFASLGNQADLDAADLVRSFVEHEPTRAIAVYCEDFRDGRAFAHAAAAANDAGKPVLLLTVGGSAGSARAARSHTGALVSSSAAVDAACDAAGIERLTTPAELVDLAQALLACPLPRGRRVAVAADGGGHSALAADIAAGLCLELPLLSDDLAARLAVGLPPTASTRNPVDLAGGGEQDISSFSRVVGGLLGSGEVDAVLLTGYFGGYSEYARAFGPQEVEAGEAMAAAAADTGVPLLAHTMYWASAGARALQGAGVPVYRDVAAAAGALARLLARAERTPHGIPPLPPTARVPITAADYWTARNLLADNGIRLADARRVFSWEEARDAANELGYPIVLKAIGELHKSDAGGVVLGLADERALGAAYEDVVRRLSASTFSLERMAPLAEGVELIVGSRRDPRFGPLALVGLGGIHADVLGDVAVALAPVNEARAEELVLSLHGAPLLTGARGRPPLHIGEAARVAAALSHVAAVHPEIAELEINPLLVTAHEAVALDARIVLSDG